jgi:hypothetical protein
VLFDLTREQAKVLIFISHSNGGESAKRKIAVLRELAHMVNTLVRIEGRSSSLGSLQIN